MLRTVFWGSPADAVIGLHILAAETDICAVYTKADAASGRGSQIASTAVNREALSMGLRVETPERLDAPKVLDDLRQLNADAFVIMAYGKVIPKAVLDIPRLGSINVHPSLLPKYRGPSPVVTAILDGVANTGVSLILTDAGLDTGPILRTSDAVPIDEGVTKSELQNKLFDIGAKMLPQLLRDLDGGRVVPHPQNHIEATVTRRVSKSDGRVDWRRSADRIERMVRAYTPWPGVYTTWRGKQLRLLKVKPLDRTYAEPGLVMAADGVVIVGCGEGALRLDLVQQASRRAMHGIEFVRGAKELINSVLPS